MYNCACLFRLLAELQLSYSQQCNLETTRIVSPRQINLVHLINCAKEKKILTVKETLDEENTKSEVAF